VVQRGQVTARQAEGYIRCGVYTGIKLNSRQSTVNMKVRNEKNPAAAKDSHYSTTNQLLPPATGDELTSVTSMTLIAASCPVFVCRP
jgi:hypothetical protein